MKDHWCPEEDAEFSSGQGPLKGMMKGGTHSRGRMGSVLLEGRERGAGLEMMT